MDRRMEIIQKATCRIIPGTGHNRLGRPIKVNLRQYLQILYIFIDNPPLTCYNIGISVSVHIVWVLRLLGSELLQATGCPDLLVLLGKPNLLVHVEVHHVLGKQLDRKIFSIMHKKIFHNHCTWTGMACRASSPIPASQPPISIWFLDNVGLLFG